MIEIAFKSLILSNPAVSSLIAERVYFNIRPEDQRQSCVVLSLVSSVPSFTIAGRGGSVTGRMQCNCLAPTYPSAKALADAVRAAIDGFYGTEFGTTICWIQTENVKDIPALPLMGSSTQATFGVQVDAGFMVKE